MPPTALQLIQRGMFEPSTSVTITNWLGSCAVPCNEGEPHLLGVSKPRAVGCGVAAERRCKGSSWSKAAKLAAAVKVAAAAPPTRCAPALCNPTHPPASSPAPACLAPPAAPGWPAAPADVSAARLSWPPTVSTNIFDVSWVYNMR